MQTIGKMEDGRVLATLTQAECRAMEAVQMAAAGILEEMSNIMNPAPELAAATPAKAGQPTSDAEIQSALRILGKEGTPARPKIIKITARSAAATPEKGKPICKNCKQPFKRTKTSRQQFCSDKCRKEYGRIYAREHWRAKHGKKHVERKASSVERPNPSDPFLTDDQRAEMMARREKLIAESARRHAGD